MAGTLRCALVAFRDELFNVLLEGRSVAAAPIPVVAERQPVLRRC